PYIPLDQLHYTENRIDILSLPREKIVQDSDTPSPSHKRLDHVRADKACSTRHQIAPHRSPLPCTSRRGLLGEAGTMIYPPRPAGDHPTAAGSLHRAGCEDGVVARIPGRGNRAELAARPHLHLAEGDSLEATRSDRLHHCWTDERRKLLLMLVIRHGALK